MRPIVRAPPLTRAMLARAARWPMDATGAAFIDAFARLCGEWIADVAPVTLPTATDARLRPTLDLARADPADSMMAAAAAPLR